MSILYSEVSDIHLLPPSREGQPLMADFTITLFPDIAVGGPSGNTLTVGVRVRINREKDAISAIHANAAETVYDMIQKASKLSLEDIKKAISTASEYMENRPTHPGTGR